MSNGKGVVLYSGAVPYPGYVPIPMLCVHEAEKVKSILDRDGKSRDP